MGRLDNKIAVVTGGASSPSLGRSMSIAFAREGAKVILTDIDVEGGKKVEDLKEAVKTMDAISLHIPLNDETKNMINLDLLKTMKKNCIIINLSLIHI